MGEALRDARAQFEAMGEAFDGLVYVCSQDYVVEYMNRRFIERTGRDATGEKCYRALHDLDDICEWCVNDRVLKGETVRWEILSPKDDRWYSVVDVPIRHPDGRISKLALITDVDEGKRAETALERVLDIIDFLPDATFVIDTDKRVIAWNRAMEEMTGARREDLLGQGDYAYAVPWYGERRPILIDLIGDEGSAWAERYDYVRGQGDTLYAEFFVPRLRDGEGAYIWGIASPLFDGAGNRVGAIESLRDVTERRRAEEALREERRLFMLGPTVVFRWVNAPGWPVSYVSPNVTAQFGYDPGDFTQRGRLYASIVHPDDLARVGAEVETYRAAGAAHFEQEYRIARADGAYRWVSDTTMVVRDATGDVTGFHGYVLDITERKRAEDEVRRLAASQRAILDTAPYIVITTDAAGVITSLNPVAERALGYTAEDCVGKLTPVVYRDPKEIVERAAILSSELGIPIEPGFETLVALARRDMPNESEWTFVRKDGSRFPALISTTALRDASGTIVGFLGMASDVTERKRAETELRAAHQRLFDIIDFLPDATFVIDADKRVIAWNRAIEEMTGTRKEEIIGQADYAYAVPWYGEHRPILVDLLGPENAAWAERYDFVHRQGDALYAEVFVPRLRDGRGAYLWVTAQPLRDAAGNIVGAIESVRDITDRKRAEKALRESEERYRALYADIPSMYFTVDPAGTVLSVNTFGASQLGYTVDELVGGSVLRVFPPEVHAEASAHVADCLAQPGEVFIWELRKVRKDGSPLDVRETARAVRDQQGGLIVLIVCEDVSERKQAEEALRESEERYRRITETITDYVFQVRVEEGRAVGTIHGPGCVAVTGYTLQDLARDPGLWLAMVVPEDHSAVVEQARAVLAGERFTPLEHRIVRKDGAVRWVRNTPVPQFGPDGSLVAYDGLIQDVTERRALEEQLLQAQKMEGIGRLAGGVAHDFNNLLTAVLGNVELASQDLPTELPADHPVRADLEEVVKAGERAASLTRQLLTFASKQPTEPVRLNLSAAVTDSLKMLRRLLGEDIEIVTALEPALGTVEADPGQIQQLLVNLAVNARDAMPNGGRLVIETANETVDEAYAASDPGLSPWRYVRLSVTDTGVGMSEEVRAHLFEPFFTTKERGKGTGLGLAICHGIVKKMGGQIDVYSEPGHGTTCRIMLPQVEGVAAETRAGVAASPTPTGTETILIVEDEPAVRRLAVLGLRAQGYTVFEAADGGEALEIAARLAPRLDALVSDVVMPGMSGPELAERLLHLHPEAKLLLMSGHAETAILPRDLGTGGITFLPKPFTPERLARKVREVLDAPREP